MTMTFRTDLTDNCNILWFLMLNGLFLFCFSPLVNITLLFLFLVLSVPLPLLISYWCVYWLFFGLYTVHQH